MDNDIKGKILLVDDEESVRQTLGDYLEFHNYEVRTAKHGEEGLKVLSHFVPDVIILDMAMPGMGGVSFLRRILDEQGKPRHPVLVLTARSVMREFFDGISVAGFVAKPSSEKNILRELDRILASSRKAKSATEPRSTPRTVLLCEDDERRVNEFMQAFQQGGYLAQVVNTGPDALQSAMSAVPDVIVLKEILTGMNGSKVAGLLSAMQATRDIPVVLYDSVQRLADSPMYNRESAGAVRKKVWTSDPFAILQAVDEVLASNASAAPMD